MTAQATQILLGLILGNTESTTRYSRFEVFTPPIHTVTSIYTMHLLYIFVKFLLLEFLIEPIASSIDYHLPMVWSEGDGRRSENEWALLSDVWTPGTSARVGWTQPTSLHLRSGPVQVAGFAPTHGRRNIAGVGCRRPDGTCSHGREYKSGWETTSLKKDH